LSNMLQKYLRNTGLIITICSLNQCN